MATQNFVEKFQFDASGFQLLNGQIPLVVRNVILISNFIFFIFQYFLEEREIHGFQCKEKVIINVDFDHKIIDLNVNKFYLAKGVSLGVILFFPSPCLRR